MLTDTSRIHLGTADDDDTVVETRSFVVLSEFAGRTVNCEGSQLAAHWVCTSWRCEVERDRLTGAPCPVAQFL